MRKLVLGIIALLSVQFAFVTYMMVLQQSSNPTAKPVSMENPPAVREIAKNTIDNDAIERPQPEAAITQPVRRVPEKGGAANVPRQTSHARRTALISRRPAHPPLSVPTPADTDFKNVVIRYNRNPDLFDCDTPGIQKAKKRSFMVKAAPVIKKPWVWMRALGSKLN